MTFFNSRCIFWIKICFFNHTHFYLLMTDPIRKVNFLYTVPKKFGLAELIFCDWGVYWSRVFKRWNKIGIGHFFGFSQLGESQGFLNYLFDSDFLVFPPLFFFIYLAGHNFAYALIYWHLSNQLRIDFFCTILLIVFYQSVCLSQLHLNQTYVVICVSFGD